MRFLPRDDTSNLEEKITAELQLRVVHTIKVLPWKGLTTELEGMKSNLCIARSLNLKRIAVEMTYSYRNYMKQLHRE